MIWVGDGTVLTSPDGITWTQRDPGLGAAISGVGILSGIFSNGTFVAVGSGSASRPSPIFSSQDGASWTHHATQSTNMLYSIAADANSFVAVGSNGAILQSGPVHPQFGGGLVLSGGSVHGTLTWLPSSNCRVEWSPEMQQWNLLTNVTTKADGSASFDDSPVASQGTRFYRAIVP